MDEADTWHGGTPQPRRVCVAWGPSPPKRDTVAPNFRPMCVVAKRQWIKMLLGTEIGLSLALATYIRWRPPKGTPALQFSTHVCCDQTVGWIKMPLLVRRKVSAYSRQCVRWGSSSPKKGHSTPPLFGHVYCGQTVAHFRYCCTAHGRKSLCFTMRAPFPQNCPFPCMGGSEPPPNL